jgi:asparagine synthase (glutamine-hydrolysing)
MGFGVPLGTWFRGELRDYVRDRLLAPDARYREMLSGPFVEKVVRDHLSQTRNMGQQLWSLLCFEQWLRLLPDWTRAAPPVAPEPIHLVH